MNVEKGKLGTKLMSLFELAFLNAIEKKLDDLEPLIDQSEEKAKEYAELVRQSLNILSKHI